MYGESLIVDKDNQTVIYWT